MGYTHSWYRNGEIDLSIMNQIKADFSKILLALPDDSQIVDTPDFWGEPQDIAFGGKKGTCEPMVFCRVSQARKITPERAREPWMMGKHFEYCKTERMPYDLAVIGLLIIAAGNVFFRYAAGPIFCDLMKAFVKWFRSQKPVCSAMWSMLRPEYLSRWHAF